MIIVTIALLGIIFCLIANLWIGVLNYRSLKKYHAEVKELIADYSETLANVVKSRGEDWEHIDKLVHISNEAVSAAQFYADKLNSLNNSN